MKRIRHKMVAKVAILALLICFISSMFTGCGFVEGGPNNELCKTTGIGDDLEITTLNGVKMDGFISIKGNELTATANYGSGFTPSKSGFTFIRDVAIIIYNSVFGNYNLASDKFAGSGDHSGFALEPATLVSNTLAAAKYTKAVEAMGGIAGTIQGLAYGILIAVWAMGFISQIVNEKFTMETLLKTLMQLLCGILIVDNAGMVVDAFASAGESLALAGGESLRNIFKDVAAAVNVYMTTGIKSWSIATNIFAFHNPVGVLYLDFGPVMAILMMAFPLVAMLSCAFKIVSIIIMRMLELAIRVTFAPIVIAFSAQNGFSQEAIRYFRGIFACAAQPALMVAGTLCVGTIGDAIKGIFSINSSNGWIGCIAMGLAFMVLSAYFAETKRLAHEIIGH